MNKTKIQTLVERHLQDIQYLKKNPQVKQYRTFSINLTLARTDYAYEAIGNFLSVNVLPTEANKNAWVRINEKENDLIALKQDKVIEATLYRFYITNDAYATGTMEIVVGIDFKVK